MAVFDKVGIGLVFFNRVGSPKFVKKY